MRKAQAPYLPKKNCSPGHMSSFLIRSCSSLGRWPQQGGTRDGAWENPNIFAKARSISSFAWIHWKILEVLLLVGGWPTPLKKNIIVSVGMMTFPRYGKIKNNKHVPNQPGYIFSWANHYFLKGPSRWLLLILYDINPRGCWKKSLRWDSALSAFGHANRPLGGALRA